MSTAPKRRMTPEEYLAFERASDVKHEYYKGEIFAMVGASLRHSTIRGNLEYALRNQLAGQPCLPHSTDLRVCVHPNGLYTYPDLLVVCGKPELLDRHFDTLLNPSLVIEIVSKSTEAYDRGIKFHQYQRIESLRAYVLVSQATMRVDWYIRGDDGQWIYRTAEGSNASLDLADALPVSVSIPLSAIYERVDFSEESTGDA